MLHSSDGGSHSLTVRTLKPWQASAWNCMHNSTGIWLLWSIQYVPIAALNLPAAWSDWFRCLILLWDLKIALKAAGWSTISFLWCTQHALERLMCPWQNGIAFNYRSKCEKFSILCQIFERTPTGSHTLLSANHKCRALCFFLTQRKEKCGLHPTSYLPSASTEQTKGHCGCTEVIYRALNTLE